MRIIVTGDRHWDCLELALTFVGRLRRRYGAGLRIIHGAAPGVDSACANACRSIGVDQEPHRADWQTYGYAAGPRRNQEMVDSGADLAIALHRDLKYSRGTRDCVGRCLEAGIPVWLIDSEEIRPRRVESI